MDKNLLLVAKVKKFLEDIHYPDSYRISKEIANYINNKKGFSQQEILERLRKEEPWEYIRGYTQFCNYDFNVTRDTLIPRVETEQLVYSCVKDIEDRNIKTVIDIGTGCGCIAISIAKILEDTYPTLIATDISKKALYIAKKNEISLTKRNTIKWINTNLIKNLPIIERPLLMVANLPYIPTGKYNKLDKSVKGYEPRIALDGGETGLDSYTNLFKQIREEELRFDILYIETEDSIFSNTEKLIKDYFPNYNIEGLKDCFKRNRFFKISH
jgi:release factor glutamine methyltransferase